ncbi:MAG: methyltransferase domain-containing protein [Acidobacteria bacterium]|nr:methyltransferase domain-containing protein [Acidobacteriota bacterium]MBI3655271.1 methyltransferase domain-containing protein [Acidobacteriota bacterium]
MTQQGLNRDAGRNPAIPPIDNLDKCRNILACTECQSPLDMAPAVTQVTCLRCGKQYPIISGVPVMLKGSDAAAINIGANAQPARSVLRKLPLIGRFLRWVLNPPAGLINVAAAENYRCLREMLSGLDHPKLLFVGGADGLGFGSIHLGQKLLQSVINTDVALMPGVDLVADGHCLPFVDESFDGVVVQSVLQHTREPKVVVDEILRVLRPGGCVYSEIPFLQRYYPGYDFQRLTLEGLEFLFRDFEAIRTGISNGPASALAHVGAYAFAALLAFRSEAFYKILVTTFRWAFAPLRYLDWLVKDHEHSVEVAGGFYFLGRKQQGAH